jgi:hypothetical protein
VRQRDVTRFVEAVERERASDLCQNLFDCRLVWYTKHCVRLFYNMVVSYEVFQLLTILTPNFRFSTSFCVVHPRVSAISSPPCVHRDHQ